MDGERYAQLDTRSAEFSQNSPQIQNGQVDAHNCNKGEQALPK